MILTRICYIHCSHLIVKKEAFYHQMTTATDH